MVIRIRAKNGSFHFPEHNPLRIRVNGMNFTEF